MLQGGQFPVRVESFYQEDPAEDWKATGGMPSEAANSNTISWVANVPAGSYAWITLVDHTGTYRQTTQPALVEDSGDDSCLANEKTAEFVTQTVYMSNTGRMRGSSLDSKSLLIVSIVFGILFFIALAGALYLYSLLNNARRARLRGPRRFALADDESSFLDGITGAGAGAMAGAGAGAGAGKRYRRTSTMSDTSDSGLQQSTPYLDKPRNEKEAPSPTSTHGENNPFLDPPIPIAVTNQNSRRPSIDARSLSSVRSITSSVHNPAPQPFSTYLPDRQQAGLPSSYNKRRPSLTETLSSATSMQLFGTRGGLRVTNDAANISTPMLSRSQTNASNASQYPESNANEGHSDVPHESGGRQRELSGTTAVDANGVRDRLRTLSQDLGSSESGTFESHRSSSTADHYESTPQSSRGWLPSGREEASDAERRLG